MPEVPSLADLAQGAQKPTRLTQPSRYNWTRAESALDFLQSDQLAEFDTRLFLGAGTPVVRGIFQTPILNARPDLADNDGYEAGGVPVELVPQSGIELELFVKVVCTQISGLSYTGMFPTTPVGAPARVRVTFIEYGDPVNPNRVFAYTEPLDITSTIMAGNGNTCISMTRFQATGPLRYWQLAMAVDIVAADFDLLAGPVAIAAGFY